MQSAPTATLALYSFIVSCALRCAVGSAETPSLPEGFAATTVAEGIDAATALSIAPDGRVFIAEQTGAVRIVADGKLLAEPAINLNERLDTWWERGLLGLTLHPDFPRTPHIFLVYVAAEPHSHHVVSRFTVVGNSIDLDSEKVLLEAGDQAEFKSKVRGGHQGGPITFGGDGMLYIGLGELVANKPSQSLDTLYGKILRIHPDGRIPEDNPFASELQGNLRAIFATGIRNPFGLGVDPDDGTLYETEVGAAKFEEINVIEAGKNYGWPKAEGPSENKDFTNPIHAYPPAIGRSVCGAMIYPRGGSFPDEWHGRLFFVDWASHWIQALDPANPEDLIPFATDFAAPVGIAAAPDGSVYVLNRNTRWRDGKKFQSNSGSLVHIRYLGDKAPPAPPSPHPKLLSGHDAFDDLTALIPADGFFPLSLNAPVRRPGVTVRRWIRIPDETRITTSFQERWIFPQGSTVVEHFDTDTIPPLRHETHIHIANGDEANSWCSAAYRWAPEKNDDATLVEHSAIVALPGSGELRWLSPGPDAHLDPDLAIVGYLLPLNSRQLHHGDQLESWVQRGWIDTPQGSDRFAKWPRLAPLDDESASLEHRIRSYLDANCAVCHRPGGPSRGFFDARYTTPLAKQKILNGPLMAGDLGIPDSRVVVPGQPEKSALYLRCRSKDNLRMPPVAVNDLPLPVLPLLEQWIKELPAE